MTVFHCCLFIFLIFCDLEFGGIATANGLKLAPKSVSPPLTTFKCGRRGRIKIQLGGSNSFRNFESSNGGPFNLGPIIASSKDTLKVKDELLKLNPGTFLSRAKRGLKPGISLLSHPKVPDIHSVAGGFESFKNSWPWMALLWKEVRNEKVFFCSGVLINEFYVITAAHCVLEPVKIFVRLGEHNVNDDTGKAEDHEIIDFIFHPKFHTNRGYHDLALLKLKRKVTIKNEVRPVCLPWGSQATKDYIGDSVKITGWGSLSFGGVQSHNLQEVDLFVFETSRCEKSYSILPGYKSTFPFGMNKTNIICAGHDDGGKDACNGDSGGPMVRQNRDGTYTMLGIVSKGNGCGDKDFPGLYAPLTNLDTLEWIKKDAFFNAILFPFRSKPKKPKIQA